MQDITTDVYMMLLVLEALRKLEKLYWTITGEIRNKGHLKSLVTKRINTFC